MKKQLFLKLIFLFCLFCFDLKAQESDRWVWFADEGSKNYYYDSETLNYGNNNITIWIKVTNVSKRINEVKANWIIYCKSRKVLEETTIEYYKDGTSKERGDNFPTKIVPDTIGELLYNYFCK